MKRIYLSFFISCFFIPATKAQSWTPLGAGIDAVVYAIGSYQGNLIAGGFFSKAGGVTARFKAEWNGSTWDSIGGYMSGSEPYFFNIDGVFALTQYNGDLVAGGYFNTIGAETILSVAKWNGSKWDSLGMGIGSSKVSGDFVNALTVYNSNLIVGGIFHTAGGNTANNIAQWNGTSWSVTGTGVNGPVFTLTEYNGNLIAGGSFDTAGGGNANYIAEWNGATWASVGGGIQQKSGCGIYAMCVYNGNLIAAGIFDSAGGIPSRNIAEWNGTSWTALGAGLDSSVYALCVYDGKLIAGGSFNIAGGKPVNRIAAWDGASWSGLDSGMNGSVYVLDTLNNNLYAGGFFNKAGGIPANNIAKWAGPAAVGEIAKSGLSTTVLPNPNNGQFTLSVNKYQLGEKYSVEVYNILGEKVFSSVISSGNFRINLTNSSSGIYMYRILAQKGEMVSQGKFCIN